MRLYSGNNFREGDNDGECEEEIDDDSERELEEYYQSLPNKYEEEEGVTDFEGFSDKEDTTDFDGFSDEEGSDDDDDNDDNDDGK